MPGLVSSQEGPVSYTVDVGGGVRWRRHTEQMRVGDRTLLASAGSAQPALLSQSDGVSPQDSPPASPTREDNGDRDMMNREDGAPAGDPEGLGRRYPRRVTKPPDRLDL